MIRQMFLRCASATLMAWSAFSVHASNLPGPVVDTVWLAANLDKVQVVEVRGNVKSFTAKPEIETDPKTGRKSIEEIGGHIPGSRLLEWKHVRTERKIRDLAVKYMIPERADFEKVVQAAGIDNDKPIVIVPVGLSVSDVNDALRMYWQFKVYGENRVAVLDGGMAAWLLDGRTYATDAPAPRSGNWKSPSDQTARYFADSPEVAEIITRRNATLVDARDLPQFHGLVKRDYVYGFGHLEGARALSPDTTYRKDRGAIRLLPTATYRAVIAAQGIDPAAPAVVYCNSGSQSGLPWFILSELLGNPNVKQYDGSLHQWTLEKRPLAGAVPLQ